ncbi:lysine--tRNA ligase [bacterium]|nr:lysine--tRNA ligase [bacterium]
MSRIEQTIAAKKQKRAAMESAGILVHPYFFAKKHTIDQATALLGATDDNGEPQKAQTAGRVLAVRAHGKLKFFDLWDQTGKIQLLCNKAALGDEAWKMLELVDSGDFLGVEGAVQKSRTDEITIVAEKVSFLGKALRPLPTSFNAASDKEVRFRKRYLDMLINPQTQDVLSKRWRILRLLRTFMSEQLGYTEVETPILQPLYGGTNARPFTTTMKALDDEQFYLRIAPELYLKRLIVGGMERIFEIARNFRNEGIDQSHLPEFTMIEWYHAYADYNTMMAEIEQLIRFLHQEINGQETLMVGEVEVTLAGKEKWRRFTMKEALQRFADLDVDVMTDEYLQKLLKKHGLQPIGEFTRGKAIFSLFDHLVTDKLIEPTWIIDYPKDVSPLAKTHRLNPDLTERYELYIGGKEISDGWSEITYPLEQRSRFENEQKRMREGDDEAQPYDEDFLEAMEYGMSPLGGVGLGIDRLVMLLTNTWSIKEVIAFPTLKNIKNERNNASDECDQE